MNFLNLEIQGDHHTGSPHFIPMKTINYLLWKKLFFLDLYYLYAF